jgi:hypothetical protein
VAPQFFRIIDALETLTAVSQMQLQELVIVELAVTVQSLTMFGRS